MKIALACDHGAFALKNAILEHLTKKGYEVQDFGTYTEDSCDYPDYVAPAARAVADGSCDRGIVMCTTGIGVSIVANKINGIRCALLYNVTAARMTREHNDTNMMAIGGSFVDQAQALEIVDTWLETEFSNGERHSRRNAKVMALEK